MGFVSFNYLTYDAFHRALVRPFYEEDKSVSNRSSRSREFSSRGQREEGHSQAPSGADFRKNKDSPIQHHHEEDEFREFQEDKHREEEKRS